MGKQLKFWFLATLTTLMVLAGGILQIGEPLMATPLVQGSEIANQLYTQYPDIPRSEKTGTTFLSRFISYHLDTQARPAQYHLDWELSMADYLEASYNSHTLAPSATMTSADKLAMQALSPQQRHQLVRTLEQLFTQ